MSDEPRGSGAAPLPQAAAFEALDAADIRWAVLRDDPFSEGAADIDLLVHRADAGRVDATLAPLGFARLPTWRHGDHRFYVAYDEERDAWAKLDVVTRFTYRSGHELPRTSEAALLRRTRVGGAWRLEPGDEFWALVLHCLLDRGEVAPRHAERLRLLAAEEPTGPLREALGSPQVARMVVERASARDVAGLAALRTVVASSLNRPGLTARAWRNAVARASPILKAGRPGLTVAVLGTDGTGKSTLVGSLSRGLPVPVRTNYLGLYGKGQRPLRRPRVPGVTLVGQLATSWRAYLAAAYHRRRGRVVVFDRYGYDALLPSANGAAGRKRAVRTAIIGRLAPHPDLVLVLDAPAANIHGRRAEHGLEDIERRRDGYRSLARRLASKTTTEVIDAAADQSTVRRRATYLVWREVVRRGGLTEEVDADGDR